MAHDKIKAAARRRMAKTGESYAAARREVIREFRAASSSDPAGEPTGSFIASKKTRAPRRSSTSNTEPRSTTAQTVPNAEYVWPFAARHGGIVPPAGRPRRELGTWRLSFQGDMVVAAANTPARLRVTLARRWR